MPRNLARRDSQADDDREHVGEASQATSTRTREREADRASAARRRPRTTAGGWWLRPPATLARRQGRAHTRPAARGCHTLARRAASTRERRPERRRRRLPVVTAPQGARHERLGIVESAVRSRRLGVSVGSTTRRRDLPAATSRHRRRRRQGARASSRLRRRRSDLRRPPRCRRSSRRRPHPGPRGCGRHARRSRRRLHDRVRDLAAHDLDERALAEPVAPRLEEGVVEVGADLALRAGVGERVAAAAARDEELLAVGPVAVALGEADGPGAAAGGENDGKSDGHGRECQPSANAKVGRRRHLPRESIPTRQRSVSAASTAASRSAHSGRPERA